MSVLRLALVQMAVGINKMENINKACQLVKEAASNGAKLIALPECFNSPYGTQYFREYSETIPGPTTNSLSKLAKECQVYLVGGSIPELDGSQLFNTCSVFSPSGEMIAKYRKMHLFDINVPGKIKFQESEVLKQGSEFVHFDIGKLRIGLGICYDIRFAELAQIYAQRGCNLLLYPGAFNTATGPLHWELLQRARALDNQLFVGTISPARDENATYTAWGHSTLIGPWGDVLKTTEHNEDIVYSEIDLEKVEEVRQNIPLQNQRRLDLYSRAQDLVSDTKEKKEKEQNRKTNQVSGYQIDINSHID